jgi:hypothetical protein
MSDQLYADLLVDFSKPDAPELSLEFHKGMFSFGYGIPIRLYPNVPAKLAASKGNAVFGEVREELVSEIVEFSGNVGNLKRPRGYNFIIDSELDIAFDEHGNVVYPNVTYSLSKDALVSDIFFYGAVKATYLAPYRLIYYSADNRYALQPDGSLLLSEWGYGTVYAFHEKKHAKIEVTLNIDRESQWMEIYRVTSDIVLDSEGAWEKPPGWDNSPKDGSFPIGGHVIDPDNSFTDERLHEIGDVSKIGQVTNFWRRFQIRILKPYSASGVGYHPKYYLQWASIPSDPEWAAAFNRVDRDEVFDGLVEMYPGITVR